MSLTGLFKKTPEDWREIEEREVKELLGYFKNPFMDTWNAQLVGGGKRLKEKLNALAKLVEKDDLTTQQEAEKERLLDSTSQLIASVRASVSQIKGMLAKIDDLQKDLEQVRGEVGGGLVFHYEKEDKKKLHKDFSAREGLDVTRSTFKRLGLPPHARFSLRIHQGKPVLVSHGNVRVEVSGTDLGPFVGEKDMRSADNILAMKRNYFLYAYDRRKKGFVRVCQCSVNVAGSGFHPSSFRDVGPKMLGRG